MSSYYDYNDPGFVDYYVSDGYDDSGLDQDGNPIYGYSDGYASDPCPGDCHHMSCAKIMNGECQAKCNFPNDVVNRCPLTAPLILGGGRDVGASIDINKPGGPNIADNDCDSYGIFKSLCVGGKSAVKGAQNLGIPCPSQLGTLCNYWLEFLVAGGLVAVVVLLKGR
jgi:hypothetical protein